MGSRATDGGGRGLVCVCPACVCELGVVCAYLVLCFCVVCVRLLFCVCVCLVWCVLWETRSLQRCVCVALCVSVVLCVCISCYVCVELCVCLLCLRVVCVTSVVRVSSACVCRVVCVCGVVRVPCAASGQPCVHSALCVSSVRAVCTWHRTWCAWRVSVACVLGVRVPEACGAVCACPRVPRGCVGRVHAAPDTRPHGGHACSSAGHTGERGPRGPHDDAGPTREGAGRHPGRLADPALARRRLRGAAAPGGGSPSRPD